MVGPPYLSLQRLRVEDVPQHPEFSAPAPNAPALTAFLSAAFKEGLNEDFESGFSVEGTWAPTGKNVKITGIDGGTCTVPVTVEQRKKGKGDQTWFARRSKHLETDVRHTELDSLLMNDHSWWEYQYTPDLYDGNLLLEWDAGIIEEAAAGLKQELAIGDIEMRSKSPYHHASAIAFSVEWRQAVHIQGLQLTVRSCSNVSRATGPSARPRFPRPCGLWQAAGSVHQHADSHRLRLLHHCRFSTRKEPSAGTGKCFSLQHRG